MHGLVIALLENLLTVLYIDELVVKLMLSDDVIKVVGYRQYHNSHTAVQV